MKRRALMLVVAAVLPGCSAVREVLAPEGRQARELADLIWLITGVATLVWLLVVLVLVAALARHSHPERRLAGDRTMQRFVTAAVVATGVVIAALTLESYRTTREIGEPQGDALAVTVRGQQWWWEFTYEGGARPVETANELHIPVGQDIRLKLESPDVIHSFWVPSLAGKLDLIPGRQNVLTLHAERPGVYRGQCAEFCGLQHSHMALLVVAEDKADFDRWLASQAADAAEPATAEAVRGRDAFLRKPCAACHTVRGTPARGRTGPDLTHVGSRRQIAAGLVENSRGTMAAWIADPQTMKPGNNMPIVPLSSEELRDISAYMESLR